MKTVSTDSLYQSTFLPIFQNAETRIKKLITYYFYNNLSKTELRIRIAEIIKEVGKKIPTDLHDKKAYIDGLIKKSNLMIQKYYDKALKNFFVVSGILMSNAEKNNIRINKPDSPKQLIETINKRKDLKYDLWAEQKGAIRVKNYEKEIKSFIEKVSDEVITTSETGKKPISLWQKAELDIRHDKQMKMLSDLRDRGVRYAWTSSHPDCSKRCEKWQGKLFNIDESAHSELTGFRMKEKIDGYTVYCLEDVMAQTDKYGYQNNIINGFNCRHHLIEYQPKSVPPKEYSATDIKKEREIESKIRDFERKIRDFKTKMRNFKGVNENAVKFYEKKVKHLEKVYKIYCESNGYAWEQYRIDI